jgi:Protein of unknown function (DUF2752)
VEPFAKGVPRLAVLAAAVAFLAAVPPQLLARGPDLCLWRHLFHISQCPACGSTRALAAFFHGHFRRALAYNRNVVVTGPLLVWLFVSDLWTLARRWPARWASSGPSSP